jgi:hypothetical protein
MERLNLNECVLLQGPLERDLVSKPSLCGALPDSGNRNASPMVVTLVAFFHFAVIRDQILTPSVAFASVRFLSFDMLRRTP